MALADAADDKGICWPSIATLAAKCNLSTRTIRRSVQYLVARDLLLVEQRYRNDGSNSSNRYRLQLRGGDKMPPTPATRDIPPGPECYLVKLLRKAVFSNFLPGNLAWFC
jgi:hypothetical protein